MIEVMRLTSFTRNDKVDDILAKTFLNIELDVLRRKYFDNRVNKNSLQLYQSHQMNHH